MLTLEAESDVAEISRYRDMKARKPTTKVPERAPSARPKDDRLIFKRRDPKPTLRAMAEFMWPRGGLDARVSLRQTSDAAAARQPGTHCARHLGGCFHHVHAVLRYAFYRGRAVSRVMQGNMLASLMATFFGNPLTYVPIGLSSLSPGIGFWAQRWKREHRSSEANSSMRAMICGNFAGDFHQPHDGLVGADDILA